VRWKLLIAGERGPSRGLVTGIAEVSPGASLLLHHHEPEETYYVVSGHGRMEIDGCESALGPGSAVFIPANATHAVHCTGAEPLVFVFCFARDRFDQVVYCRLPLRYVRASWPRSSVEVAARHAACFSVGQSRRLPEKSDKGDHMGMEAGTMALLTLVTALITALLSLVSAVGVLLGQRQGRSVVFV
jgi:uncharacterized cupin superfamily protein